MSCHKLAVYSPEDIYVFVGTSKVEGFSLDSVVSISKVNSVYIQNINSDGSVSRTHKGDDVYNVAISLNNASEFNQVLTYLTLVDRATQMGKFPMMIKDQQGGTLFNSATSWVEAMPDSNFTSTLENRDWLICCSHAHFNVGGNFNEGSAAMDIVNTIAGGAGVIGGIL